MYNGGALGGGAGSLATTGLTGSLWLGLAAFALIAVGAALMRIVPKRAQ